MINNILKCCMYEDFIRIELSNQLTILSWFLNKYFWYYELWSTCLIAFMAEAILGNNHCQHTNGKVILNLHLLEIVFTVNCGFFPFEYLFKSVRAGFFVWYYLKIRLAKSFSYWDLVITCLNIDLVLLSC